MINYPSKAPYATGKVLKCEDFDNEPFCDEAHMPCRRVGTWTFFYENGVLEHTEEYRWLTSCDTFNFPEGIWNYYDKYGSLIRQDEYREGIAWNMLIHNYSIQDKWAGKVRVEDGKQDTTLNMSLSKDQNSYIANNSFDYYIGDPVPITRPGQLRIEEQLPCWINPKSGTPDYYNPYRRFDGVPDNFFHPSGEEYSYVGLILFQYPSIHFTECITGELKRSLIPGKEYCFRMRIRLSQNSGYYLGSMGAFFTERIPKLYSNKDGSLHYNDSMDVRVEPQVLIEKVLNTWSEWDTVCGHFIATGREKYVTIGRFSDHYESKPAGFSPFEKSQGGFNNSAYYLIDKVEIVEDPGLCVCSEIEEEEEAERFTFNDLDLELDKEHIKDRNIILDNIYFKFDRSTCYLSPILSWTGFSNS